MPKVSVIVPMYNAAAHVRVALDSVLSGTYRDIEVIAVDDGSSDETVEIVSGIGDPRLRLVANPRNQGISPVLNQAWDLAGGEYLVRMDADDIARPERIAKLVDCLDARPEIAVCGSQIQRFGAEASVSNYPQRDAEIRAMSLFYCVLAHPTVAIRRAPFDAHGLRFRAQFRCAQDYDLWTRAMALGLRFGNLPDVLLDYRVSPGSVTSQGGEALKREDREIKDPYIAHCFPDAGAEDRRLFADLVALQMPATRATMLRLCMAVGRLAAQARSAPSSFSTGTFTTLLAQYWTIAADSFVTRGLCSRSDIEAVALADQGFGRFLQDSGPVLKQVNSRFADLGELVLAA